MNEFLRQCRKYFIHVGVFSFFINLLMLTLPIYMLSLFERVIGSRSMETLVLLTIAAVGALFLSMLLDVFRSRILLGAGITLDGLAGPRILNNLITSAGKPVAMQNGASLRDVAILRTFLTGPSVTSLFDAPWVPVYILVIFMFHPLLGMMATMGAVALFTLAYINEKVTRGPLQDTNNESIRAGRYIDSGLRNSEVINALGMSENLISRWQKLNDRVIDAQVVSGMRGGLISSISRFLRMLIQILMLATGASLVIQQHVSTGIMIAGTLILARALAPVEAAITTWKGLVDARGAYKRLNDLMLSQTEVIPKLSTELPRPSGKLEVDSITFGIPGQDRLIIRGVSFSLDQGDSLGLIGPSAAGKSTLARLMTGVWRPVNGVVRLDGADVSTWKRNHLGKYIGYLPQDIELFTGTVGENIARLGHASSEEIIEAAQRAHVHEMIMRLPQAYDTEVGEGGIALSTGQRQRIGLARALFGFPSIVILDEPNANLDSEGEAALMAALQDLASNGVTTVTVSHRPSLLANVSKLLVLNAGRVELFGPRAEVLSKLTRGVQGQANAESPVTSMSERRQGQDGRV